MILCGVPASVPGLYAAGNWKDVAAIRLLSASLDIEYQEAHFDERSFAAVLDRCTRGVTDLLVHYSRWPKLVAAVRENAPWIRVHVRAHNAEALQHWQRCEVRLRPTLRNVKHAYAACRVLLDDILCRCRSHTILGISDWDNRYYWSRLPGRAEVHWVPYYCPWPWLRENVRPAPWSEREEIIVCMAGAEDPIGKSMVAGFRKLAECLSGCPGGNRFRFLLSPGTVVSRQPSESRGAVTVLPELREPWDLLCRCRAVAVLSPLGFGTKTTIIDGLTAGCHVLVDPVLAKRLPEWIRSCCLECDAQEGRFGDSFTERLLAPPVANNVNGRLRAQAAAALRRALAEFDTGCRPGARARCGEPPSFSDLS